MNKSRNILKNAKRKDSMKKLKVLNLVHKGPLELPIKEDDSDGNNI